MRKTTFKLLWKTRYILVSLSAGMLTALGLMSFSGLTAQNFLAEGADTTLSRSFMAPFEFVSAWVYDVTGIQRPLLLAIVVSVLVLAFIYHQCIRWLLVPFARCQRA
jgi:hypothetical protein